MQINELRTTSPEQLSQLRSELLTTLQEQLALAATRLTNHQAHQLDLQPQRQQDADTCLFACLVAIKKAIAKKLGSIYMVPENQTALQARAAGILRNGGTFASRDTQNFIRDILKLQTDVVVDTPVVKLGRIISALEAGNVPLISYSLGAIDHWIAILEIRLNDTQVEVVAMNPLLQGLETMTAGDFAKRLAAGDYTTQGASFSQLMIVELPDEVRAVSDHFKVTATRKPQLRIIERRPGNE